MNIQSNEHILLTGAGFTTNFGVKIPTQENVEKLSTEFDGLVSTKTNYQALKERIEKTKENKSELLLTLKYPEIPLHNNAAELGARSQIRKRDMSLHTMTQDGTRASDTFMTIVQTAKKLGVSVFDYIGDRVNKSFKVPSLAELIGIKKYLTFELKC